MQQGWKANLCLFAGYLSKVIQEKGRCYEQPYATQRCTKDGNAVDSRLHLIGVTHTMNYKYNYLNN